MGERIVTKSATSRATSLQDKLHIPTISAARHAKFFQYLHCTRWRKINALKTAWSQAWVRYHRRCSDSRSHFFNFTYSPYRAARRWPQGKFIYRGLEIIAVGVRPTPTWRATQHYIKVEIVIHAAGGPARLMHLHKARLKYRWNWILAYAKSFVANKIAEVRNKLRTLYFKHLQKQRP